jgi:hypothetical protein
MLNDLHELALVHVATLANGQDVHVKPVGQNDIGDEIRGD